MRIDLADYTRNYGGYYQQEGCGGGGGGGRGGGGGGGGLAKHKPFQALLKSSQGEKKYEKKMNK